MLETLPEVILSPNPAGAGAGAGGGGAAEGAGGGGATVDTLRRRVEAEWSVPGMTAERRWVALKRIVNGLIADAGGSVVNRGGGGGGGPKGVSSLRLPYASRIALEKLLPALVFTYTYPRLDVGVSIHRYRNASGPPVW